MATTKSADSDTPSTVVVERGGGMGAGLIVLAIVIVGLIAGYFLFSAQREDRLRTDAISGAASSVSDSASNAAASVSDAAKAVTPSAPAPSNAMQPAQ